MNAASDNSPRATSGMPPRRATDRSRRRKAAMTATPANITSQVHGAQFRSCPNNSGPIRHNSPVNRTMAPGMSSRVPGVTYDADTHEDARSFFVNQGTYDDIARAMVDALAG